MYTKNIIEICPKYWPHVGGVETHVEQINRALTQRGYKISVITEQHDIKLPLYEKYDDCNIYRIRYFPISIKSNFINRLMYKLHFFYQIIHFWHVFKTADIIHIHDVFWWIIPIYPFFRSKMYITFHGWEGVYPIPKINILQRRIYSFLCKGVIHVGGWIKEFYGDRPNTVVYGGIPFKLSPIKVIPHEYGMLHVPYTFVFIGRLDPENEIEKYISFFKLITTKTFKPRVLWVGDGKFRDQCSTVGKVLGFQKNVSDHIHRAKIVCASSYLSMMEAQAYGKIVCAFYSNPLKKAYLKSYPGSKYLIMTDDIKTMKQRVEPYLYASPSQLDRKADEIKALAISQTWEKVANEYEWLWQQ